MKPTELLQRLRNLSQAGKLTDTVLIAPLEPSPAASLIEELKSEMPACLRHWEGQVTAQDLAEFVDWVDVLRENSWRGEFKDPIK